MRVTVMGCLADLRIARGGRHCAALLLCLVAFLVVPCRGAGRWWTYEECRLIPNKANDGDSFHVQTKSDHFIFRLYFVDAPETDNSIPGRIKEQAEYWGISKQDALVLGKRAAAFTADFLRDGFTVHSKRADARGRSQRDRYFGMVKELKEWLGEALIREGFARVYGAPPGELPAGGSQRKFLANLRVAERVAKREGKGGWGMRRRPAREGPDKIEKQDVILDRPVGVYSLGPVPRLLASLPTGTMVTVLGRESRFMVRVQFTREGEVLEGKCRIRDMHLEHPPPRKRPSDSEDGDKERTVVLDRPVGVYSLGSVPRYVLRLPQGATVTVLGQESPSMVRIRYEVKGKTEEGKCRARDLP